MYVKNLYLKNFRLHTEGFFEFHPSVNLIFGPNAHGKTTLLEALYFLATGRSFRSSHLKDLIELNFQSFFVEVNFIKHGIEQVLKVYYSPTEKKIVHNQTQHHSATSLLGLLQAVVITPDDDSLVKGGPSVRRNFLDLHIAQLNPLYVHHLTRYNRAMKHRNVLLKSKKTQGIESWEHEMANSAAYLVLERNTTVNTLESIANSYYKSLSGNKENLTLTYKSGYPLTLPKGKLRDYFIEQYSKYRSRELMTGFTLVGPHKDDLVISLNEKDSRVYASEGQQRSCVTALHFAKWQHIKDIEGEAPLMLIDDIGISLDQNRKELLFSHLKDLDQVFLTSTGKLSNANEMHLVGL